MKDNFSYITVVCWSTSVMLTDPCLDNRRMIKSIVFDLSDPFVFIEDISKELKFVLLLFSVDCVQMLGFV